MGLPPRPRSDPDISRLPYFLCHFWLPRLLLGINTDSKWPVLWGRCCSVLSRIFLKFESAHHRFNIIFKVGFAGFLSHICSWPCFSDGLCCSRTAGRSKGRILNLLSNHSFVFRSFQNGAFRPGTDGHSKYVTFQSAASLSLLIGLNWFSSP